MKKYYKFSFLLVFSLLVSCKDLTELNVNPNGIQADVANPNLVLSTVLTEGPKLYLNLGFGDISGVMQHTQGDAWFSSRNDYDWSGSQSWTAYYDVLRNNQMVYNRAVDLKYEFHQGVTLTMRAFLFGLITDLWGDAPYANALKGDLGGNEYTMPKYDSQESIYAGVLADLEKANTLLSKSSAEYQGIDASADVIYGGNPAKWRKLANSLALRYYLRISGKLPEKSKAGIEKIVANPTQYPIITEATDDATLAYVGNNDGDSWPSNTVYDASGSNYRRIKMCATLVNAMQAINDPRLAIWAKKVEVPLVVDATLPAKTDVIKDGKRYLSPDKVGTAQINTNADYVGLPPSVSSLPSSYNLNPTPGQLSYNPHVSYLNEIYKAAKGSLLKARLISAAEVHFILAEASQKGWAAGNAQTHYESAIKASLTTWGVSSFAATYLANEGVKYKGTLEQLMQQKWIASWTAATESWFDFRRTGLPALTPGPAANRRVLPIRFYYMSDEIRINQANAASAIEQLEESAYSQADGKNSAWSKSWLIKGTSKPW
ncbi:SusD/RagB family nutrient-binding outer membrane lipoprotein [Siphonobacter sp. SORGH_AS_0500]|uniref:SusD/RagB family nutrient-binding outer membrane lipoprotein n=1 Tax=Siphonobacter sp. SORGH_AS_0500 TaxID=1864824 RepID=UPI000CABF61D|nr:SusD/RagB family nutrient-binding outer membrane lipoprotein [Siphonobacter sp. SORGH_AS_0500]PKK35032.1 SusD/RagB family nutrient-binding outer membrane lipoprotein [Siphonobacter sp. SORGH_AS_0500]